MKTKGKCPACKGTGVNEAPCKCTECNGDGKAHRFQMIFWHYDQFPFVLADRGFISQGRAYLPAYNSHFTPCKVMPLKSGKALKAELNKLKTTHDDMIFAVRSTLKDKVRALAPWAIKD
jgi:hypothetical protein